MKEQLPTKRKSVILRLQEIQLKSVDDLTL